MGGWNLEGRTVLITGGTHGIGLACAEEFKSLGAEVTVVSREQGFDVTKAIDRKKIKDSLTSLDILVNNVGMNISRPTGDFTTEDIAHLLDANFISTLELTRVLYPLLKSSGNGSIINIASLAGSIDLGTGSVYASAKAAVIQLTRSLAAEYAADNIRVNSVSPWYTETRRTEEKLSDNAFKERLLDATPLHRIAKPAEIASVVAFLAMDKSAYITGQDIIVDGGVSAARMI